MLPQKHKEATKVQYNSGFFITTNILPDFGQNLDGEAVYRRLEVFETKTLKNKDLSVTGRTITLLELCEWISDQCISHNK